MNFLVIAIFFLSNSCVFGRGKFLKDLMDKMTLEDKCGQMTQVHIDTILENPAPNDPNKNPINKTKLVYAIRTKRTGSFQNTPYNLAQKAATWQHIITSIQDVALSEHLKIPALYGIDSIHGANYIREATLFPQPIGMAATFNLEMIKKVAQITAEETRAVGIPWSFNPVLDVGRQPLWPRFCLSLKEDDLFCQKLSLVFLLKLKILGNVWRGSIFGVQNGRGLHKSASRI